MTVYLVGAGPGDPGLLTLRGRELLERCDALVYDRLADPRIVGMANPGAERVYAGKEPKRHALSQDEITSLLVELGRRCETVVRLKGGDPFIFGRGGEEALALEEAGIAWEVVPGISSAYAVPAYAGIPVTQRGMAAQVTLVTGHEDPAKEESGLDWELLARTPGTLVFLMGVGGLERNAARLIEHGKPPDTPAAVIASGTRSNQRTVTAPLHDIARAAEGLWPPAITLVGDVAALHQRLAWFERRPLFGRRVVVTRARPQASGLAASYDVVCLTSANGVERLLPADVRALHGVAVAAVGRATAAALAEHGIVADVVPGQAVSEALLDALGDVAGKRILVATAQGARTVLPDGLRERGAEVDVLHVYRTTAEPVDADRVLGADLVTFSSSSTVTNVLDALNGQDISSLRAVSIGPVTTGTLRERGITPLREANPHDVDGLVAAVLEAASELE
jgi:uroporphyrinogen III methyltransferase / synthase